MALQCVYGCSDERGKDGDGEDESETFFWKRGENEVILGLCDESEEDLKAVVGILLRYVEEV